MVGKLELIIGPMFSGKSTEIIRRIRLLKVIKKKIIVIKPEIDNRYNKTKITSHNFTPQNKIQ
jgi:thymidine kinase